MIGIIIGIAIGTTCFILCHKESPSSRMFNLMIALFACVVCFFLVELCVFNSFNYLAVEETAEMVASQEVIALQDNSSIQGHYFLGSGSINNREYYVYYYETEYGYKQNKLPLNDASQPVYIKYIPQGITPHIDQYSLVEYTTLVKKPSIWSSLVGYLSYKDMEVGEIISRKAISQPIIVTDSSFFDNYRIEIHIPEGSIKEGYIIDLE
ncbi:MAG: hypothetical protein IJZ42_01635 [Lachnospiraceae bacterium]|nr:hypothetical protein [Lachnospiraceae bacterium]